MSHRIIVLDEAEDELIAALVRVPARRTGSGIPQAIDEAMDRLAESPLTASPIFTSTTITSRRMLVKRFPYSIIFVEHNEGLWVIAFAHNRRRPGYWRERLIP